MESKSIFTFSYKLGTESKAATSAFLFWRRPSTWRPDWRHCLTRDAIALTDLRTVRELKFDCRSSDAVDVVVKVAESWNCLFCLRWRCCCCCCCWFACSGRCRTWLSLKIKFEIVENVVVVPNTNTHNAIVSNTIVPNTIVKLMLSSAIRLSTEKQQLWIEKRLKRKIPPRTCFNSAFSCEKRWLN